MANVRLTGFKKLKKAMKRAEASMPSVRAATLNNMAFNAMALARSKTIKDVMTTRNKFTAGSVRFIKARKVAGSVSVVGSVQGYMAEQEFGKASKEVSHVPTDDARIQKSRARVPSTRQRMRRKNWGRPGVILGNRQAMIAIKAAQSEGEKGPFFMQIRGKRGIQRGLYRLRGTGGNSLRMFHNVSINRVNLKARPWLRPAALAQVRVGMRFFIDNFKRQLR